MIKIKTHSTKVCTAIQRVTLIHRTPIAFIEFSGIDPFVKQSVMAQQIKVRGHRYITQVL